MATAPTREVASVSRRDGFTQAPLACILAVGVVLSKRNFRRHRAQNNRGKRLRKAREFVTMIGSLEVNEAPRGNGRAAAQFNAAVSPQR